MTKVDLKRLVTESVQEYITEGMLDNMMKGAKPANLPPHLYDKLLGMGNVLAGGFENQVSDDIKIVAAIMYYSSGNKETNIFDTVTSFQQKGIKENTMKRSELKGLVKEVVRQCIKEAGPQYKVRDGRSYVEKTGQVNRAREIQSDPGVNEVAPPGGEKVVKALKKKGNVDNPWAVAWSMKNKGEIEEQEPGMPGAPEGGEEPYEEQDEIRLIKAVGKAIVKLLQMHKGMEEPEEEAPEAPEASKAPKGPKHQPEEKEEPEKELDEGGPQYKVRDGRTYAERTGKVNRARQIQSEPEVNESNHKVQHRSYKTVNDVDQDPKNVRDPEVPQA